jgi:hypothetical protein
MTQQRVDTLANAVSRFWNSKYGKSLLELIFWSAVVATLSVLIESLSDINNTWVILIIPALSLLKGLAAKKVGNPDNASFTKH